MLLKFSQPPKTGWEGRSLEGITSQQDTHNAILQTVNSQPSFPPCFQLSRLQKFKAKHSPEAGPLRSHLSESGVVLSSPLLFLKIIILRKAFPHPLLNLGFGTFADNLVWFRFRLPNKKGILKMPAM